MGLQYVIYSKNNSPGPGFIRINLVGLVLGNALIDPQTVSTHTQVYMYNIIMYVYELTMF